MESFTVFDKRKSWSKIQNESDGYEGWVNNKHFLLIEKANFEKLQNTPKVYSSELVDFIWKGNEILFLPLLEVK